MKKAATTFAAFLFGAIVGFLIAQPVFQWLASPFGAPLVAMSPAEPLIARGRFVFGCGVLFAAAAIFSRSPRRFFLYLAVGIVGSVGAAASYRASYESTAAILPADMPSPVASMASLPALLVPLSGAIAIACLALAFYFVANRTTSGGS